MIISDRDRPLGSVFSMTIIRFMPPAYLRSSLSQVAEHVDNMMINIPIQAIPANLITAE
jgi:hypothetical protein